MKYLLSTIIVCSCFLLKAQQNAKVPQTSIELPGTNVIAFHVDGMNTIEAQTAVINSINKFPTKIISWVPNITSETIKISFTKDEQAIDILELISATGYKPWYINQKGMKVVLVGTNKTEEHYIKQ